MEKKMPVQEIIHEKNGLRFLIRMEDSQDPRVYGNFESLRFEIWGDPEDHLAGTRNLACENYLDRGGSLFISVLKEEGGLFCPSEELVGFSYGFVGVADKAMGYRSPDNLRFYSQYTAVKKEYQGYGLGVAIKRYQRDVVRNLFGIKAITCTFDPLSAVNAFRNIGYFGMSVLEYKVACYSNYTGFLNRLDIDCDRFFMFWDLEKNFPRSRVDLLEGAPRVIPVEMRIVCGRDGTLTLPIAGEADLKKTQKMLQVEIPSDFYIMLQQTDVEDESVRRIPRDWREATREVFNHYFSNGWKVTDFIRDTAGRIPRCYYVLKSIS